MGSKCRTYFIALALLGECNISQQAAQRSSAGTYLKFHHGIAQTGTPIQCEETRSTMVCCMICSGNPSCYSGNAIQIDGTRTWCELFGFETSLRQSSKMSINSVHFNIEVPTECAAGLTQMGSYLKVQLHLPTVSFLFLAQCDVRTDRGGWIILQRRQDGCVDFNRNWMEYRNGFGDVNGEYWLGLEKIYQLMKGGEFTLRIDLWDGEEHAYAKYNTTTIGSEADNYRLHIGNYEGTAGDSLRPHNGKRFSTFDKDNDPASGNCAATFSSGNWFERCIFVNVNGMYGPGSVVHNYGIMWRGFKGVYRSLSRVEMKIKKHG